MTHAGEGPAHHKAKAQARRRTTSTVAITTASDPGTQLRQIKKPDMTKRARPSQYADGLMDALTIVAEVSGPLKMSDFNEATWKMLCGIQGRIAGMAAAAIDANGELRGETKER